MSAGVGYVLRPGQPGDEEVLSLVGAASFLESFAGVLPGEDVLAHCRVQHAAGKYAAWLGDSGSRICVAEVRDAPVGYAVLTSPDLPVLLREQDIELRRIYLLHRFHGTGLGRAMMEWAIDMARSLGRTRLLLAVYGQNDRAIAFYRRHGFTDAGTREFRVGSGTYHDLVLGREL